MASTYNPYSAVQNIYNLKGQWDNANNAGDITTRDNAAKKAQEYYQQLRDNGYGSVADELQKSNYAQSKTIHDKWAKMGKTSTRDYMYSLGTKYGMSNSDIDNLISWDNDTGEVSFGGKKIGTPDVAFDGASYWSDTSVLDNAFNDYISRTGTVRSNETAINQENDGLFAKYNQAYEDLTKTNPFTTAEAKAIMGKYDLAGLQARDNAVASSGASNGGNIDSYASANAMRQQSALVNQGQMAVLDAHKQKIDNIRGILSDMGVNIDRVFNQDQTAKNNEVARLSEQATVSGYNPTEWTIKNDDTYNQFLNADGTFKKEMEGVDIQALIDQAKARGDNDTANKLAVVRGRKILGNYAQFGQWSNQGDISFMTPQKTAEYDTNLKSIDSAERIAKDNNATTLSAADKEVAMQKYIAEINASTTLSVAEKEAAIQKYAAELEYDLSKYNIDKASDSAVAEGVAQYKAVEAVDKLLGEFDETDTGPRKFITEVLVNKYTKAMDTYGGTVPLGEVTTWITSNAQEYNIDVEDAEKILDALGLDYSWVREKYQNCVDGTDDVLDSDGNVKIKGSHRGMKRKN